MSDRAGAPYAGTGYAPGAGDSDQGIACMWMRGGTSKGGYFLAHDLPADPALRDAVLLRIMGSPDARQIDGMGGGDPLTSKVAIIRKSERDDADIDYLFLQIFVDQKTVSDAQNCGNILAGVGPFAIERGLVDASDGETAVRIYMENSGQISLATVRTPGGAISYAGDAKIDGVPGTAAPIPLAFQDIAGSMCGSLLPTGNAVDTINGTDCTLIDNGMPCIVMKAADFGITGYESCAQLEGNSDLKARIEAIRLAAGGAMNLGDVAEKSVPKMMLVAPPRQGGSISVRSFIPHRVHAGVGVLGAVTVATACLIRGSAAFDIADTLQGQTHAMSVEHPSGSFACVITTDDKGAIASAAVIRTARKLFDGKVFA